MTAPRLDAASPGRVPKTVSQITSDAQNYEYDAQVSLKHWLRTAANLIKQAAVYVEERDDEMVYFLLFRHAHLVLTNLEAHAQAKAFPAEMKALKREVLKNLETLDVLKPALNKNYEVYQRRLQDIQAQRDENANARFNTSFEYQRQPSLSQQPRVQHIRSEGNSEVAARLAGQEFSRRSTQRQQPSGTPQNEREDMSRRMQLIRQRIDHGNNEPLPQSARFQPQARNIDGSYSYPTIPANQLRPSPQHFSPNNSIPPLVPSKIEGSPALPPKLASTSSLPTPPRPEKAPAAVLSQTPTEPAYSFAAEAFLESGAPLRTVFLPPTLRTTFLRLAQKNTSKNLETCGFLAGTLRANALFVTTLVVPEQIATSDTCEMTNESDLFDYVDQHELMVLGWIHTHPSQTCFMSSRDLHTHAGYQMMLAESIAIVCAPSKGDVSHGGDWGTFRLTDPPGKMAILQCDKPGVFHPHDVDNVYTDAKRPGHVREIQGMEFEIVDLRTGS